MSEAPRWRLHEPHYLKVPELPDGTRVEWEHKETMRETGRAVRKLYAVPMLLNPNDPADHNYPGEIIVTHFVEGSTILARDYVFEGDPTPGMEPINHAAQEITDRLRAKWDHPIDGLATSGNLNPQEAAFMEQMVKAFSGAIAQSHGPATQAVSNQEYEEMKERVARLEALLASQVKTSTTERRI